MNRILLAGALLTLAFASRTHAGGALAVAIPEGGLRENFAFGRAVGGDNAAERAMKICRDQARARGLAEEKCKVVENFQSGCISLAIDPEERWAGWAVAPAEDAARAAALKKCAEGAKTCKTHSTACTQ